jgi:hypothetical protein
MVLGRAIESYGDGTGQVKKVRGIDRPETDCWRNTAISPIIARLHASEPLRDGSRIEANASSDVERGNSPGCGLLENRHL